MVSKLSNEGKTTCEIAKGVHISPRPIGKILNKLTGDDKDNKKQRLETTSDYARSF
jgi:DNA invertase Pin-like site-specific DNA recombinase